MEIKLYDYYDEWSWCYIGIGMGNNSAEFVCALIDQAVAAKENITVRINSGGGGVFDGWAIYNALIAAKKTVTVSIQVDALAASIASIIAMAGTTLPQFAKASMFMIHKPTVDPFWYGAMDAEDLKKEAAVLDQVQAVLASLYANATGLDESIINEMINAETWLTPAQCETLGFGTIMDGAATKPIVSNEIMNNIFAKAPSGVRAYANKIFTIKENTMSKENKTLMGEVRNLITNLGKHFPAIAKVKNASSTVDDGTSLYYDGELKVDTEVFTDEAMTVAAADGEYTMEDGTSVTVVSGKVTEVETQTAEEEEPSNAAEVEALKNELAEAKAENATLVTALTDSKNALEAINKVKSNYVPKDRTTNFSKDKDKATEEEGLGLKERKAALKEKK